MTTTAIQESVARRDPIVVATADAEAVRSDIVRTVLRDASGVAVAVAAAPTLTFHDILSQVARGFGPSADANADADRIEDPLELAISHDDLLAVIMRSLDLAPGRRAIVVIAEAHLLHRAVLARIPAFFGLAADGRSLTVVLVGDRALDETLRRPELQSLAARVSPRRTGGLAVGDATHSAAATGASASPSPPIVSVRVRNLVLIATVAMLAIIAAVLSARKLAERSASPTAAGRSAPAPIPAAARRPSSSSPGLSSAPGARLNAAEVDARLQALHDAAERRATELAARGDVTALLALREQTRRDYESIGANRPDFLEVLMAELDVVLERGRAERVRLDGAAYRRDPR